MGSLTCSLPCCSGNRLVGTRAYRLVLSRGISDGLFLFAGLLLAGLGAVFLRWERVCFFGCWRCGGLGGSTGSLESTTLPCLSMGGSPLRLRFSASRSSLALNASVFGAGLFRIT